MRRLILCGCVALSAVCGLAAQVRSQALAMPPQNATPNIERPPLPADSRKLIDEMTLEQEKVLLERHAEFRKQRETVIAQLTAQRATARPDVAGSINDAIRELEKQNGSPAFPEETQDNLMRFRGRIGEQFAFQVVGRADGSVWGNGIYTDDSLLAAAAVHAGILRPGEQAVVRVTILAGRSEYGASSQNGINSSNYGPWQGSYLVQAIPGVTPKAAVVAVEVANPDGVQADPGNLLNFRNRTGQTLKFDVTGAMPGPLWGTGTYTDDSSLATAAVHAGALRVGERGIVSVTFYQGQGSYQGSTQNGVTSQPWNQHHPGSFQVERAPGAATPPAAPAQPLPPLPGPPVRPAENAPGIIRP